MEESQRQIQIYRKSEKKKEKDKEEEKDKDVKKGGKMREEDGKPDR